MGTKEEIIAQKTIATERYILSTLPVLFLPLYRLDGSPFISADGHGHTCTVTGATWGSQGRDFEGVDDKISIAHNAVFNVGTTGNFTFEWWAKVDDISATRLFITKEVTTGNAEGIFIGAEVTTGRLYIRLRQDASNYAWLSAGTGQALAIDTFYHLVFLRTGSTLKAYINGVQDTGLTQSNTGAGGASNPDNAYPLLLGLKSDNSGDFDGIEGEVRFYNRALTLIEIQNNYLATAWRYR